MRMYLSEKDLNEFKKELNQVLSSIDDRLKALETKEPEEEKPQRGRPKKAA